MSRTTKAKLLHLKSAQNLKHYALIFASAVFVGLTGCPVTQVNRLPPSSPLRQPAAIYANGDFTHVSSGYVFPAQIAAFRRVDLLRYDTGGLDVSAGYNDALLGCLVVLTIYVFPTPRMTFVGASPDVVQSLEAHWLNGGYDEAKQEIVRAHPDAMLESEDAPTREGVPGKKAIYAIGDKQSELYLSVIHHAWFLEYRNDYPKRCASQALQALEAVPQGVGWIGPGLQRSATGVQSRGDKALIEQVQNIE